MKISVIIPMYNEEDNVIHTLTDVENVLSKYEDYEVIVVDDGSYDDTSKLTEKFESNNSNFHVLKHIVNMGMGRALRTGFENALINNETIDIVVGSPYMEGGEVNNVPIIRLIISKIANKFAGFAMSENLSTVTAVLRAYRKDVLDSLELESNGTEINLEILSKASATKYRMKEVPAVLEGRKLGNSKLKFRAKTISHLLFSFYEKPMILFGFIGLILCIAGLVSAVYLFYQYILGTLDPTRPLMIFMILTILSGIQILIFGFVATQISLLKREIYMIQKENKLIRKNMK